MCGNQATYVAGFDLAFAYHTAQRCPDMIANGGHDEAHPVHSLSIEVRRPSQTGGWPLSEAEDQSILQPSVKPFAVMVNA